VASKIKPSMRKSWFLNKASPLTISEGVIGDQTIIASPRQFSSGACGWFASRKTRISVDGVMLKCQITMFMNVEDSQKWKA